MSNKIFLFTIKTIRLCDGLFFLALGAGFEPATSALTARRSTTELSQNTAVSHLSYKGTEDKMLLKYLILLYRTKKN